MRLLTVFLGAACLQDSKTIASWVLTQTEIRYAQIEKELFAVVFACTKFSNYIYSKPVTIETDHQSLVTIIKCPKHSTPARLQQMLLQLQRYNITLVYKKRKAHVHSRHLVTSPTSICTATVQGGKHL